MSENNPSLCAGDPLARALARLEPVPSGINREQLLFEAGRHAAGPARVWKWLAAGQAVALAGVVAAGVYFLADPPQPEVIVREVEKPVVVTVYVTKPAEEAPPPRPLPGPPVYLPPAGGFAARSYFLDDPADADERAKWLRLRNDVFAAGLGVLPTPHAQPRLAPPGGLEKSLGLPPNVYAVPPKPTPPKQPDPPADPDQ